MPPAPKGAAHGPVQFKNLKKGTIIRLLQLLKPLPRNSASLAYQLLCMTWRVM